jgi:hypothetical protein
MPKDREFDAYNENFVADSPDAAGKYPWLVRIYTYAKEPGLVHSVKGAADTPEQARVDVRATVKTLLEKYRRAP